MLATTKCSWRFPFSLGELRWDAPPAFGAAALHWLVPEPRTGAAARALLRTHGTCPLCFFPGVWGLSVSCEPHKHSSVPEDLFQYLEISSLVGQSCKSLSSCSAWARAAGSCIRRWDRLSRLAMQKARDKTISSGDTIFLLKRSGGSFSPPGSSASASGYHPTAAGNSSCASLMGVW